MYKIGDFSQMAQVSIRMLRHYDKLGLLKPEHVDVWTGYRYYTLSQLERLHRILAFRDLGLSLEQIGEILDNRNADESLRDMLMEKREAIEQQMLEDRARLDRVAARLDQIERVHEAIPYEIAIKELPPQKIAAIRDVVPNISAMDVFRDRMLRRLYSELETAGIEPGMEMAIYHHQSYTPENISMSLAVEVDPGTDSLSAEFSLTIYQLPSAPIAASIIHNGTLWDIPDLVFNLYRWLGLNSHGSIGAYRELHRFGRELDLFDRDPEGKGLIEILVPVQRL